MIGKQQETGKKPAKKKKVNYLNNKDLLSEIKKSKEQGQMTDKLARMLQMLVARYAKKSNWAGYTFNEDMQSYATMMLVKTWSNFNAEKYSNPFGFYTQCIKNSFRQYLKYEKGERDARDATLVRMGYSPSLRYQMEHSNPTIEDEEDYEQIKQTAQNLTQEKEAETY